MASLLIEPLPPRAQRADVLEFLAEKGNIDRRHIAKIELRRRQAVVEVPDDRAARLIQALDGSRFGELRVRVAMAGPTSLKSHDPADHHLERLARLLEIEARAESQLAIDRAQRLAPADAERAGSSLVDLVIQDQHPGLGGRFLVQFTKRNRSAELPWTRLAAGAPVLLSPAASPAHSRRGVVSDLRDRSIEVAMNEPVDEEAGPTWRLDLSGDEIVRQRTRAALDRVRLARGDRLHELRDVLLGPTPPAAARTAQPPNPLDRSLDASQCDAVAFALHAPDLALIHGPPGTGKTTVLVELIRQAVRRGERVLACAPSNLAVDNMLERLVHAGERAVRLGHPARVLDPLRERTLDLLVASHGDVKLSRKLVRDAIALFRQAGKYTRAKPEPGARQQMRQEAKSLLDDARRLEAQAVDAILESADILCATTTGLDSEVLGQRRFDLVVIDEACQSTEPGCWIPVPRAQRIVLAGDHCQLPPTVVSREAAEQGFAVSLFERLVALHGQSITRRLGVQYRMHEQIMRFSNDEFYDGELAAHPSVAGHRLRDLPGVLDAPITATPLRFIDTAGAGFDEETEPDGESRLNRGEARLVARKARELIDAGVPGESIAIISPYAAQVRLLRNEFDLPEVEIDTVDGFQGREKEAVLISLVRSNTEQQIGFLSDVRRMNVAMTRARRALIVVGDSSTIAADPFYERLLKYFDTAGAYGTVWEEDLDA